MAGYNTSSAEEKAKVNIKRLLVGGALIVMSPALFMLFEETSMERTFGFVGVVIVLCVIVAVLANTWAKQKDCFFSMHIRSGL